VMVDVACEDAHVGRSAIDMRVGVKCEFVACKWLQTSLRMRESLHGSVSVDQ
jgi:hypothetical protein